MTVTELQQKIDRFKELIDGFGQLSLNGKVLWQLKIELNEYFKGTSFADATETEKLLAEYHSLSELLKEKQEIINKENEGFAIDAEQQINKLTEIIGEGFYKDNPEKEAIAALKGLINEIYELFKQTRWPSKEKRTALWEQFSTLRESLKKEEDDFYNALKQQRAERAERSEGITSKIIEAVKACDPSGTNDLLSKQIVTLKEHLSAVGFTEVQGTIKDINEEDINRNSLKPKSETLRDIRRFTIDNRDDLVKDDKQRIFTVVDSINLLLNKAWDEYREAAQKKQEDWEERRKTLEAKRQEWEVKQKEFLKTLEERLEKKIADKTNLEKIVDNKKEFLGRQKARFVNQQDFVKKITEDLLDMEEKLQTAWSDNFKERMTEKVEQKKTKIAEVNADIAVVTFKIVEVEKDIEEILKKIEIIEKSTNEMKIKAEEIKNSLSS